MDRSDDQAKIAALENLVSHLRADKRRLEDRVLELEIKLERATATQHRAQERSRPREIAREDVNGDRDRNSIPQGKQIPRDRPVARATMPLLPPLNNSAPASTIKAAGDALRAEAAPGVDLGEPRRRHSRSRSAGRRINGGSSSSINIRRSPRASMEDGLSNLRKKSAATPRKRSRSPHNGSPRKSAPRSPKSGQTESGRKERKMWITACKELNSNKDKWQQRVKALETLAKLVQGGITNAPGWDRLLTLCSKAMQVQLEDERSKIVKEVCKLLLLLAATLGADFMIGFKRVLPALFSNLYVKIKVISLSSHECIVGILAHMKSAPDAIPEILRGIKDSHSDVRKRCCEYLLIQMRHCEGHPDLGAHRAKIQSGITTCVKDADKDVRAAARSLFFEFESVWPDRSQALIEGLGQYQRQAIEDGRPQVR